VAVALDVVVVVLPSAGGVAPTARRVAVAVDVVVVLPSAGGVTPTARRVAASTGGMPVTLDVVVVLGLDAQLLVVHVSSKPWPRLAS
jgi:hypothetical protein